MHRFSQIKHVLYVLVFTFGFAASYFITKIVQGQPEAEKMTSSRVGGNKLKEAVVGEPTHTIIPFNEKEEDKIVKIHRHFVEKMTLDLFDPSSLQLRPYIARRFGLSLSQEYEVNSALGDLFIQLRKQEANHSEIATSPSGEEYLIIRPHQGSISSVNNAVNSIANIVGGENGARLAQLLVTDPRLGKMGTMQEDVSVVSRDRSDGRQSYRIERIVRDKDGKVVSSSNTFLRESSTVREAYEYLFGL